MLLRCIRDTDICDDHAHKKLMGCILGTLVSFRVRSTSNSHILYTRLCADHAHKKLMGCTLGNVVLALRVRIVFESFLPQGRVVEERLLKKTPWLVSKSAWISYIKYLRLEILNALFARFYFYF